ncbi:MAG TPA: RluA family pseudouridine synthase [Chitinophagales bacterium]|nr:RluA family pseudouridine synthase [Chitinophagales bacterium]
MSDYDEVEEELSLENEGGEELYEHHKVIVDSGQKTIRIDVFLQSKLTQVSRSKIQNAAKAGSIIVNGQPVKSNYKIRPDDVIQVMLHHAPQIHTVIAEDLNLDVVYDDDQVLLINKPAGMVVHPGHGNYTGTLVNGLMFLKSNWPQINGESRPGIVHRLDKNTSGILVAGKTEFALQHLAKQFFDRTTDRNYIALVWGDMEQDKGRIEGNIARHPTDRLKFHVDEDELTGKFAATTYEVIRRFGYVTLIKCKLETGRTHQIRVHMKHIGHPLFNDFTYGGDKVVFGTVFTKYKQFVENCFKLIPAQALHAASLGFKHPTTGKEMKFEVPLPEGFQQILDKWETYTNALQVGEIANDWDNEEEEQQEEK